MNGLHTSYLSERKQITVIDGITSSSSSISHGVPQGSVLVLLLFLLLINGLPNSFSLLKFMLLADGSTLSTSLAEEYALEFTLALYHELNNVNNWLTSNRICINTTGKTKYVILSYRKLHLTNIKLNIVHRVLVVVVVVVVGALRTDG